MIAKRGMKSTSCELCDWRRLLMAIFVGVVVALSAGSCVRGSDDLLVDEQHRQCETDGDCARVFTRCDGCECGSGVNRRYESDYRHQLEERCKGYGGGVCDPNCVDPFIVCDHHRCVNSPSPSAAAIEVWESLLAAAEQGNEQAIQRLSTQEGYTSLFAHLPDENSRQSRLQQLGRIWRSLPLTWIWDQEPGMISGTLGPLGREHYIKFRWTGEGWRFDKWAFYGRLEETMN